MIILLYVKKEITANRIWRIQFMNIGKEKREKINWHSASKYFLIASGVYILGQAQNK